MARSLDAGVTSSRSSRSTRTVHVFRKSTPIRRVLATLAIPLVFAIPAHAQSAQEWVAKGDSAYTARKAPEALKDFDAALAADPKNYDALWRAARAGIELGEFDSNADHQHDLYKTAEQRARLAVQINPADAWGHFVLSAALGRTALSLGVRDRVKYAGEVRDQALLCLKADPKHSGCLHVMGVWNAEIMRLNGFSRMIAKNFLGGKVFNQANWDDAQKYLTEAIANDPRRIIHRLDLAKVYSDLGMKARAKAQYELVVSGDLIDYNDPKYKEEAQKALKSL